MSIKQELAAWDKKSADAIRVIYSRHSEQSSFLAKTVELINDSVYQRGATWLLKCHLEAGNLVGQNEAKKIYGLLPKLEHWEAKLHILQCIPYIPIATEEKRIVEAFLRGSLSDTNKFVRAWSYNGFYVLSSQYPEYREEVMQFFEMAMRDEPASVKARIRNIMKAVSDN